MIAAQTPWPRRLYWRVRASVERARSAARLRAFRRDTALRRGLNGKVAVITGAGAGIGLAITKCFARAGASCVIVTLKRDEGEAAVAALAAEGYRADLAIADVANEQDVREAVAFIAARYAAVDILVNNAGVYFTGDREAYASALTDELVEKTLAVNLYGAIHMSRALAPLIPRGGRIINVSSVLGRTAFHNDGTSAAYRMSKAALNSYTLSLAADLQSRGIMVDCFHPGWVKTEVGGPGAKIDPSEATDTAFLLATRPPSKITGRFWQDCAVQKW